MRPIGMVAVCLAAIAAGPGCKGERASPFVEAAASATHHSEVSAARPIFNVRSFSASQRYYREALGFKLDWDYGHPPDFGSVSRGDGTLFLCEGCPGGGGAWVMFFVQDVDKLHREILERKAHVRMPPKNMPWGLREMQVTDLDGNVMRFGTGIKD